MARTPLLLLVGLLASTAVGARDGSMLAGSPAYAPASSSAAVPAKPKAELTFFVTADNATFKNEGYLKLKGAALTVPYLAAGKRVKVLPTGAFANSSIGSPLLSADGAWLDRPQAILYGYNEAGNLSSVVLSLDAARFAANTRHLKFNVSAVPATPASVKLQNGPVSAAVVDSKDGVGPKLQTALTPNETWTGVTLVVESASTALHQPADTKWFGWGWGGGWGRPWGGWGWGGPWWG